MIVHIPTYKRMDRQPTAIALANAGISVVFVVRKEEEIQAHEWVRTLGHTGRVLVLPETVTNIGETRQYIVDTTSDNDRVIMMDDDLTFAVRGKRTDNPLYLTQAEGPDVVDMVKWMWDTLGDEAIAGISAREGNNRKTEDYDYNSRLMRCWGLNLPKFHAAGATFTRIDCMEDFDVMLTMLEKGYRSVINNNFTTNQAGSNVSGGCSTYRTLGVQAAAANKLASLHPGVVKVVEKETKAAWGGGTRTDVTVYWKKAYAQGVKK